MNWWERKMLKTTKESIDLWTNTFSLAQNLPWCFRSSHFWEYGVRLCRSPYCRLDCTTLSFQFKRKFKPIHTQSYLTASPHNLCFPNIDNWRLEGSVGTCTIWGRTSHPSLSRRRKSEAGTPRRLQTIVVWGSNADVETPKNQSIHRDTNTAI